MRNQLPVKWRAAVESDVMCGNCSSSRPPRDTRLLMRVVNGVRFWLCPVCDA